MDYKQHKGNLRGQIKNQIERKLYNKRIRAKDVQLYAEHSISEILSLQGIKEGGLITFKLSSNSDSEALQGTVRYIDQLGFVTNVNGKQYELRHLLDIKILNTL